jgi:TonB family protein
MKVSLVVLGALALSFVFRHRSAALRHWLLAAGIVCAAAVPAMKSVLPAWSVPFAVPAAFEPYGADPPRSAPAASVARTAAVPSSAHRGPQTAGVGWRLEPSDLLIPAWIAGTAVSFSILFAGLLRLFWLASRSRSVTHGRLSEIAAEVARGYGLPRPVALLQSEHPSLLVTWGVVRPKVILPAAARAWPADRLRVVLAHEMAHIRRGDWPVQLTAEVLRAIYWFNPLLWVACRRLRVESEHACDDEVMNGGVRGPDYAGHLVEVARALNQRSHAWFPAPAMARPSSLERRVRAMLNDRNRAPLTRKARGGVFAALLVIAAAVAAAQSGLVTLTGAVTDEHDRGIPGAIVVLTNEPRQAKYEIKTADGGRFEFVGLPAGSYGFEVRGVGFKLFEETLTVAAQNLHRNVKLQLGSLEETISVFDDGRPVTAPGIREVAKPTIECTTSSDGGRIIPPRKIRDVHPLYPEGLRGTGTEGTVVMQARIGVDGYTGDISIIKGAHPDMDQAAVAAVREWRFTETLLNCQPVEVTMTVTTNFRKK